MMQSQAVWLVCTIVLHAVTAQYAVPPTKGKKHRTTTTTTEGPGGFSNEISGPFPVGDVYPQPGSSPAPNSGGFWWQGADSPFKPGSQSPPGSPPQPPAPQSPPHSGGCGGPSGCTGVGTAPRPSPPQPGTPGKPVDIAQNPFLSSAILGKPLLQSPQGCQGASGGGCQYPGSPTPGTSGSYPQYPGQPSVGPQYPTQPSGQGQYPGGPSGQPGQQYPQPSGQPGQQYPQPSGQAGQQYPQPSGQPGQQYPQPSGQPGQQYPQPSGQPGQQYPQPSGQPGQQYPQPSGQPGQQYPKHSGQPGQQYPGQYPQPSGQPSVPLRPQCVAAGHACVPSSMCVGGVITSNGLRQMRDPQIKECIPGLEACCRLPQGSSYGGPVTPVPDYTGTQRPYTGPLNTTPYPGCAAALKCVAETYCTAEGVMSDTPVVLTREQAENKVPLTDCQDLETKIIGKCCRDPNYKDPWPAGMMMKNPGDFDDGQYHGEGSGPGSAVSVGPSYNSISSTPYTPTKDHGPKPSDSPGGFNKPFPPPFPGNIPDSGSPKPYQPTPGSPYQPGKPTPGSPYQPTPGSPYQPGQPTPGFPNQPGKPTPGSPYQTGQSTPGSPYQPSQPTPSSPYQPGQLTPESPYQPGQPTPGSPYQPGKPTPGSPYQPTPGSPYQPGQPTPGSPYQPGQSTPGSPYQPEQPTPGSPYQPGQPTPGSPYQPGQPTPGSPYQPGQPTPGSPYQPGQPTSGSPYQPGQPTPGSPYQPGQPTPGSPYQPGQPTPGSPYQPGQPTPGSPYQPGQPTPGSPYQPGQPTPGSTYQPGQPIPSQPDFPDQQTDYNIPTHPGQNQPTYGQGSPDQGPAPGSSCGIRRPGPPGDVAGFGEFPWQAIVTTAGNRSLICGAAIVAENAVITAAHCVNQLRSGDLLVKAGEWRLLAQNPKPTQVRPVIAIARHPGYNSGSLAKDLAVLILAQPFTFDIHVDKICIPPALGSEYFQKPGQNCVITGWGKNALRGPEQNAELHKVDVNVIPAKQCESKLKSTQNLGKFFILNEGFSCALPPSPLDLCKVDYGSAVACAREDGHYEIAGVNSWDIACPTQQPLPTVFATSDAQWLETVLNTPTPVLQEQEKNYDQSLQQGEAIDGVDTEDKPGFSQGYGK